MWVSFARTVIFFSEWDWKESKGVTKNFGGQIERISKSALAQPNSTPKKPRAF